MIKILLVAIYALGKYADCSIFSCSINAYTTYKGAPIFDKGDREAQIDHSNFLQPSGLADVQCFLAKRQALIIKLYQIDNRSEILDTTFHNSLRFQLHHSPIQSKRQSTFLIHIKFLPALILFMSNLQQFHSFIVNSFHRFILIIQLNLLLILLRQFIQGHSLFNEHFAICNKLFQSFFIEKHAQQLYFLLFRE